MVSYQEVEMRREHADEIAGYVKAIQKMYHCDNCRVDCGIKSVFRDKLKTVCGNFIPLRKPSISRQR